MDNEHAKVEENIYNLEHLFEEVDENAKPTEELTSEVTSHGKNSDGKPQNNTEKHEILNITEEKDGDDLTPDIDREFAASIRKTDNLDSIGGDVTADPSMNQEDNAAQVLRVEDVVTNKIQEEPDHGVCEIPLSTRGRAFFGQLDEGIDFCDLASSQSCHKTKETAYQELKASILNRFEYNEETNGSDQPEKRNPPPGKLAANLLKVFEGNEDNNVAQKQPMKLFDLKEKVLTKVENERMEGNCSKEKKENPECSEASACSVKNRKAMFENLANNAGNEEKNPQPQPGTSKKAVAKKFGGTTDKCAVCNMGVYATEKIEVGKKVYHKQCFRCLQCNCILTPNSYCVTGNENDFLCVTHYKQLFKEKGRYS